MNQSKKHYSKEKLAEIQKQHGKIAQICSGKPLAQWTPRDATTIVALLQEMPGLIDTLKANLPERDDVEICEIIRASPKEPICPQCGGTVRRLPFRLKLKYNPGRRRSYVCDTCCVF